MRLHKYHIRALVQAAFAFLVTTSCINDNIVDDCTDMGDFVSDDTPRYVSVQLKLDTSQSSNRAASSYEENGTHAEHVIGTYGNRIIFFYKDKNDNTEKLFGVYGLSALRKDDDDHKDNSEGSGYEGTEDFHEAEYTRIVYFYARNGVLPSSCLVVLNASDEICDQLGEHPFGANKENILDEIWSRKNPRNIGFSDETHTYFTMTNSIYIANGAQQDVVGIDIDKHIHKTIPNALKNPITVHVERMVAKFSMEEEEHPDHIYKIKSTEEKPIRILLFNGYDDSEIAPDDANDPGILLTEDIIEQCQVRVTGWGINALETQSNLFKNISGTSSTQWNDNYRYHWSVDPHYDYDKDNQPWGYPWQYRSAVEKREINYYGEDDKVNLLRNYSYSDFFDAYNFDKEIYCPENTYDPQEYNDKENKPSTYLDERTSLLAGTHLIVCAQMETNTDGNGFTAKDLYRDRIGVYYESVQTCLAELIRQFNRGLRSQSSKKYHYYNWDDNQTYDGQVFTAKSNGDYQLYYNDAPLTYKTVMGWSEDEIDLFKATVLNGDGKLLPWRKGAKLAIKDKNQHNLEIYNSDYDYLEEEKKDKENPNRTDKIEKERFATSDDVKSMLYEWIGAIDHFKDGKMYYAASILHAGAEDPDEAKQTELGDYGVVRNHWYKLKLKDINELGTPVDEPTEPIVPNKVKSNDQLNCKVILLPWHEITIPVPLP